MLKELMLIKILTITMKTVNQHQVVVMKINNILIYQAMIQTNIKIF